MDVASELLEAHGYLGLRMDQIAERSDCSKGTIYQHFPHKEEMILALMNRAYLRRIALCEFAVTQQNQSRAQVAAIGAAAEVFLEQNPQFYQFERIVRLRSVWEKTSSLRQEVLKSYEVRWVSIVKNIVQSAVSHGDLELPRGMTESDLVFGIWSILFAGETTANRIEFAKEVGLESPSVSVRKNTSLLLDAYRWRPLSSEMDMMASMDDVKLQLRRAFPGQIKSTGLGTRIDNWRR